MPKKPMSTMSAEGDSKNFVDFMRRLMQVPHAEIKAKLDAEKEAKRTPKNVSRVSAAPSKAH